MRHQVAGYKLNRTKGARIALRRNLIKQFFTHERIRTTTTKAAAIRGEAERMITIARKVKDASDSDKVAARRLIAGRLGNNSNDAVKKLFDEIAPRFADRNGGYTRVLRLAKPRLGDAGTRAILELVGKNDRVRRKAARPAFESSETEVKPVAPAADESTDVVDEQK